MGISQLAHRATFSPLLLNLALSKYWETFVWPLLSRRRQPDQIAQLKICQNRGDINDSESSANISLLRIYLIELDLSNYTFFPLFAWIMGVTSSWAE
jgi:hypothetical protein